MSPVRASLAVAVAVVVAALAPPSAATASSEGDLPVLSTEVPRGSGRTVALEPVPAVAKAIDGDVSDWTGEPSRYGGTAVYSAGEYVYQDHLFDAYGPDDGRDAQRLAVTDPLAEAVPEAYRLDPAIGANAPGQAGIPVPDQVRYRLEYGDATSHQDHADIQEVRVALDDEHVYVLVRTTTMTSPSQTGVLVLADTSAESQPRDIGFNSGITTERGDVAAFLGGQRGFVADLGSGTLSELPAGSVATNPDGYVNAVEAKLPRASFVKPGRPCPARGRGCEQGGAFQDEIAIAVATGSLDAAGTAFGHQTLHTNDDVPHANLANVSFRFDEPVREWFEKRQALSLHAGTIDPFFTTVDPRKLSSGATESFVPGPGYHDRLFDSSDHIASERGREGMLQHYGVYLPTSYRQGVEAPLQLWLHWRGGNAHTGAAVAPRLFKHFGEDMDTVVVSPSGRGTSRWYVGKGHADFLEVWEEVFETFSIDASRVYASGHSMGGWGSYLLTILYPDRFAAAAPVAGPVTQGAWVGLDNCGPCYISANDGRPQDQHTRRLLDNLRHVPLAILHGTADELVPYPGVARQAERLLQLGYRHRFYTYPTYEHFTHPVVDQWAEAARYLHMFELDTDPARVTYQRDMPFEKAVEEVQSDGVPLTFDFDSAYWMSDLTPVDEQSGVAHFDGRSLAIEEQPYLEVPDTAPPASAGSTGPYVVTGLGWLGVDAAPATQNGFEATLRGAAGVGLDLERMRISVHGTITASVTTDSNLLLELRGPWSAPPQVVVNGEQAPATLTDGILAISLPPGDNDIVVSSSGP